MIKLRKRIKKGEIHMNANVLKPNTPFISRKELKRKPPSADYVERVKFMNSNEFSFSICKDS